MVAMLSGCVTVEMPNVVSDTAKVGKDVYLCLLRVQGRGP